MEFRLLDPNAVKGLLWARPEDCQWPEEDVLCCSIADVLLAAEQARKDGCSSAFEAIRRHCQDRTDNGLFTRLLIASLDSYALEEGLLDCHRDGPPVLWAAALGLHIDPLHSVRLVTLQAVDRWSDMSLVSQAEAQHMP